MYSIINFLSKEIERPTSYGWYHFMWLGIILISIILMIKDKNKFTEKKLNAALLSYSITAFILELIKQIIWSYDSNFVWDYQWYSFPYQLCTTPIYASLIAVFTKNDKIKNSMLSYISFFTIIGSIATAVYPETCFCKTLMVDVHTMYLHCGSLILSIYILMNKMSINFNNFISGFKTFLMFLFIALLLNIFVYNIGVLNGEEFNMFYISPYFISSLPVFNTLQTNLPYIIYLFLYILSIFIGGFIVYLISKKLKHNTYYMRLNDEPFNEIKNGTKTIEYRLYDEKRRLINKKDYIIFTNISTKEKIKVKVIDLYKEDNFDNLFNKLLSKKEAKEMSKKILKYYTKDGIDKYGVIGIRIKKEVL